MRSLFTQLTHNKEGLPKHSLITAVHYYNHGSSNNKLTVEQSDRRSFIVRIYGKEGQLIVVLRPLRRPLAVRHIPIQHVDGYDISFTIDTILQFVTAVGDNNPIHQTMPYVVPGLLILETLWHAYHSKLAGQCLSIYFHNATIAGDQIRLDVDEQHSLINGHGVEALLFSAQFC